MKENKTTNCYGCNQGLPLVGNTHIAPHPGKNSPCTNTGKSAKTVTAEELKKQTLNNDLLPNTRTDVTNPKEQNNSTYSIDIDYVNKESETFTGIFSYLMEGQFLIMIDEKGDSIYINIDFIKKLSCLKR
jgi:hypothetical protein